MRAIALILVLTTIFDKPAAPLAGVASTVAAPLAERWAMASDGSAVFSSVPGPPQGRLFPAFDAFLHGAVDLALLTRELSEADFATYRAAHGGAAPAIVPVAGGSPDTFGLVDPVVVIVNRTNPLRGLSLRQLDALLSTTRWRGGRPIDRWRDLKVGGRLAALPVHVVGGDAWSGEESARALTVRRHVLSINGDLGRWRRFEGSGPEAEVVARVAADPAAIGFTGAGHLASGVKAVALEGVLPSRVTVASGRYPLARTIDLLLPRDAQGCLAPRAVRFAGFLLSERGQAVVRAEGRFLPLTPRQRRVSRALVAHRCLYPAP